MKKPKQPRPDSWYKKHSRQLPPDWPSGVPLSARSIASYIQKKGGENPAALKTHWWNQRGMQGMYAELLKNYFFGARSWSNFLEQKAGIIRVRKAGNYLIPINPSSETLKGFIQKRMEEGVPMDPKHWYSTPGLKEIYRMASENQFNGLKSWKALVDLILNENKRKRKRQKSKK